MRHGNWGLFTAVFILLIFSRGASAKEYGRTMILPPIRIDGFLDFLKDKLGYIQSNDVDVKEVNDPSVTIKANTPLEACRNWIGMNAAHYDGKVGGIFGVDIYLRNISTSDQDVELSLDGDAGYVGFATCSTAGGTGAGDYLMDGELQICSSHLDGASTSGNKVVLPINSMSVEHAVPTPISFNLKAGQAMSFKIQLWFYGKACVPQSAAGKGHGYAGGGCANGMLYRFAVSPVIKVVQNTGAVLGTFTYGPKITGDTRNSCAGTVFDNRWLGLNSVSQSNPVQINGGRPF